MSTILNCPQLDNQVFLRDCLSGLSRSAKTLSSKYFYDERGSRLFEDICELKEYYPTRTELSIMRRHVREMAECAGVNQLLLELGSGASIKTRLLIEAMDSPAAYLPFDISVSALEEAEQRLTAEFPTLSILPICGDFMSGIELPDLSVDYDGVLTYFPGSTIGNLEQDDAIDLMRRIRNVTTESNLLIGIDLEKDRQILLDAYNDADGVTAAFNLNLLERMNRELDADFDLDSFEHRAIYHEQQHRIEMRLYSSCNQRVSVAGQDFTFRKGESICTEYSHKYTIDRFHRLAESAGFQIDQYWTDSDHWFAVVLLTPHASIAV